MPKFIVAPGGERRTGESIAEDLTAVTELEAAAAAPGLLSKVTDTEKLKEYARIRGRVDVTAANARLALALELARLRLPE